VRRPLVVAHRGGSAVAPENTRAAIVRALREGADAVEVDVLPSRDGHLVVHHDERLLRTAGLDRAVWDCDLAELRALDVGRWFGPAFAHERIMTLEEAAAMLPEPVGLVADFKHGEERFPGLVARVAAVARPLGPRFAVLSIQHAFALAVAAAAPGARALLTLRRPLATPEELAQIRGLAAGVGLATSMRALSADLLVAAAETDRPVYLFLANSATELDVAMRIAPTAVISDRVADAVQARGRSATARSQP
jgi:glycerophosphoryl diester phosphodiesterase